MYRDVAVINVPDLVIMKTYKETIVMLLDQMKSIADHACIEEVALSIMLGKQNTTVSLKILTRMCYTSVCILQVSMKLNNSRIASFCLICNFKQMASIVSDCCGFGEVFKRQDTS